MKKNLLLFLLLLSLFACDNDPPKKVKELKVKVGSAMFTEAEELLSKENITPEGGVWVADEKGVPVPMAPPKGTYPNYYIDGAPPLPGGKFPITLIVE